jgi:GDPmannose 4,6-dehydratase
MGNIDALRDWGHAKDYVRMQWMMLQQDTPDDFVIATGLQYSVRDFILWTAKELGLEIEFRGSGVQEIGVVTAINGTNCPGVKVDDVILRIDERYFRPTEVETLLGDPSKASSILGWKPEISAEEMCAEMVAFDLKAAQKEALLITNGYAQSISTE